MGLSLFEKSFYLQWEFIWQNLRGEKSPSNGIGMTKLHRFSYLVCLRWLDGSLILLARCVKAQSKGNVVEFQGCVPFEMPSQHHEHELIFHLATDGSPVHFLWAEVWGFDVEIDCLKIHSNLLYKLTVVAMESQWRKTLLTLLALLSCLFFCLIQVWFFPCPLMEGNDHEKEFSLWCYPAYYVA